MQEGLGHWGLEMKMLPGNGVVEIKAEGVEAEASAGIVAVTVLDVAADGVPKVLKMHPDLVFAPRLKFQFHKAVMVVAAQGTEMRDGIFPAIVNGRTEGEVCFVVLQPRFYGAFLAFHASGSQSHVAAVGDDCPPIVLQNLFGLNGLGVDKQSAGVAVEAVYHMGCAFLPALAEIVVKDGFDAELMVVRRHGENADVLLNDADMTVLIYQLDEAADKGRSVLALGDFHCHSGLQHEVVLCDNLAVYPDATAREDGFCL